MNSSNRLAEVDALRGIAAAAVVCYHLVFRYDELYGHAAKIPEILHAGQYGVQLFFMISGFVIFLTLNRVKHPADFLVSRFSRLYPTFWAALILTTGAVYLGGLAGREIGGLHTLANALMFHEYFGVPHVDGVYWTLTVELTFYFWVYLFFLFGRLNSFDVCALPIISVAVLEQTIGGLGFAILNKILIAKHLPFFIAGIAIFKLSAGQRSLRVWMIIAITLATTGLLYSTDHLLLFGVFYMVFYAAVTGRLVFLRGRGIVWLGAISYPLYLLHQNIGYVIIQYSYGFGLGAWAAICVAGLGVLALAWAVTVWIEQPAMRFIRSSYQNNENLKAVLKGAFRRLPVP